MTNGNHIPQEDLALYAMQSLSSEESSAVRLHLQGCEECRTALAHLSGDLAALSLSVEQLPLPQGARQRFIEKISPHAAPSAEPVHSITRKPSRVTVWIPWATAAAFLIATVLLGLKVRSLDRQLADASVLATRLSDNSKQAREVLDLLTAPKAQRVVLTPAKTPPAPSGRAVYLAENGGLIFQASHLDRLAPEKTYELWVIPADGKSPIPAGLFRPDDSGSASIVLPPLPKGVEAKAFGVTVERASGSDTPTLPIVLSGTAAPSVN